jgi:hypothetical protein
MILKETLVVELGIMSRCLPRNAKEYHTEPSAFVRPKLEPSASKYISVPLSLSSPSIIKKQISPCACREGILGIGGRPTVPGISKFGTTWR